MRKAGMFAVMMVLAGAAAAEQWTPDQNICNRQTTTIDIASCLQERTKFWDSRLNQAWRGVNALLASSPESKPRIAQLKAAQLAWIKFRDANCAFYYSEEGTIRQIDTASCFLEMTQNRAIELQGQLPQ